MITEFTKPWNNAKVWLDSDEPMVVLRMEREKKVYQFTASCNVDNYDSDSNRLNIYCKGGEPDDASHRVIVLEPWESEDVKAALCEAFANFDVIKGKRHFLCPSCKYGQLLRIIHEPPHYGEGQYTCKFMTRLKQNPQPPARVMDGDTVIMEMPPSIFDYEDGPGGWDGNTCPNFVEHEKQEAFEVTTNG